MSGFISKSTFWSLKEEPTYAAVVTINPATDLVELMEPSMEGDINRLERNVQSNSLVKKQSLLGKKTSSGTLPLEVSTTDATGKLNGDVLYKSGMGVKIPAVVSEVVSVNGVNTLEVASGAAYGVGQALKLTVDESTEYRVISGISANTLTVNKDFVGTTVTAVEGLLSYRLAVPKTKTTSFTVQEYIENDTTQETYTYKGCVVSALNTEFPVADIIKTTFSVQGAGFTAETSTPKTKICTDYTPHVAKNMTFTYGTIAYDVEGLSVNVENDVQAVEAVTAEGITDMRVVNKPKVGGSFTLEYEGKALFDAYLAGTTGALEIISTASNGKYFGVFAPKVSLVNAPKTVDNMIYKNNIEFECLSSDACIDGVEDALTLWFE